MHNWFHLFYCSWSHHRKCNLKYKHTLLSHKILASKHYTNAISETTSTATNKGREGDGRDAEYVSHDARAQPHGHCARRCRFQFVCPSCSRLAYCSSALGLLIYRHLCPALLVHLIEPFPPLLQSGTMIVYPIQHTMCQRRPQQTTSY